jgi:hypothetical protein
MAILQPTSPVTPRPIIILSQFIRFASKGIPQGRRKAGICRFSG